MIYIFSVLFCVVLAVIYDIRDAQQNKQLWYNLLLLWFILISGLQYCVGTDIFEYIRFYQDFNASTFRLRDLDYYMSNQKQPGWIILTYLCKLITNDFIIVKLIQAIFINVALFSFFKRETKYIFLCVLVYALISYFALNFNVYRHSFALGFALYGFSYLRQKRYINYYLFVALAWLFHNSAIILIIFPLFNFLKYNRWTLIVLGILFIMILPSLNSDKLQEMLFSIIDNGFLGENLTTLGDTYMKSERQGVQDSFSVFTLRRLLVLMVVCYYVKNKKDLFMGSFGVLYLLFVVLSGFMQALWRFRLYIDPFYYILLATVIAEFPRKRFKQKVIVYMMAFWLLLYLPIREYLVPYVGTKWRPIDQYYPYHSIFDPEINYEQKAFFENL